LGNVPFAALPTKLPKVVLGTCSRGRLRLGLE
jgi:hypothetical protein